jgi:hypothetical protein
VALEDVFDYEIIVFSLEHIYNGEYAIKRPYIIKFTHAGDI